MKNAFIRSESAKKPGTRRITILALIVAAALVIAYAESMLPPLIPIAPGAKLGLSNIAPLFALIVLGIADAYAVMFAKTLLCAVITGGVSALMYSLPAGLAALTAEVVLLLVAFDRISVAMISLIGAVTFNCAQLFMACIITGVNLISLLPLLMLAGLLAGAFTGLLTYYIVKKLPIAALVSRGR